ncbi:MAG: DUF2179 domain-containing protein [Anaerolineae bacterium]|nr:DUF2179 domain-containing protein [Anaerolineae bacterium]
MPIQNVILGAVLIFLVRVISITLSTIRYLIMGRANKVGVTAIAFVEALTFALTFGVVASDLTNMWYLMAYCAGFAIGTLVGTSIEQRIGRGYSAVNIVSMNKSLPVAEEIRKAGFGATRTSGEGNTGTVGLIWVVVRRRDVAQVVSIATEVDPNAFVTVEEARSVMRGFIQYERS